MRSVFGLSAISATSLLILLPHGVHAQFNERHQLLMPLTLQELIVESDKAGLDGDIIGHIFFRCSITFSVMGVVLGNVVPKGSPDAIRVPTEKASAEYHNRSQRIMVRGTEAFESRDDQVLELFKEMYRVWTPDLINGGTQMFLVNEEGSAKALIGKNFKEQVDICDATLNGI